MIDESVCFECDAISFDRISMMYYFNHNTNRWNVYTTKEYQKALEFCLKDMYFG